MEIFVRLTEEQCRMKVNNGKHLGELTGLSSELPDDMQHIFLSAMVFRLVTALIYAIKNALKYKDLLQIDFNDFTLPEEWIDSASGDIINKMKVIKLSIAVAKDMGKHAKSKVSLQKIAKDLEAPYEVIEKISKMYGGN